MSAQIPVNGREGVIAFTVVDDTDEAVASAHNWHLLPIGYAVTMVPSEGGKQRSLYLHRLLLGLDFGDKRQADHINRDRLDNRRSNLRVVTHAENSQNRGSKPGSLSSYRGVTFDLRYGLWRAYVCGKTLGRFPTEIEAARVAARFRAEHMPFSVEDPSLLEEAA